MAEDRPRYDSPESNLTTWGFLRRPMDDGGRTVEERDEEADTASGGKEKRMRKKRKEGGVTEARRLLYIVQIRKNADHDRLAVPTA